MNRWLRHNFWVVQVLGLAMGAYFAASAFMTLFVSEFVFRTAETPTASDEDAAQEEEEDEPPAARVAQVGSNRSPRAQVARDILSRNVFCPGCRDEEEQGTPGETASPSGPEAVEAPAIQSNLPLQLMATMEGEAPELSLATIYDRSRGTTGLFGVGDRLSDGVVLTGVYGGHVELHHRGRAELLRLGQVPAPVQSVPPPPAAAPVVSAAPPVLAKGALPGAAEAISCTNETTCVVERKFVNSLMSNPAALASQASVRPSAEGFKFARVRPGTLPHLLGLQTGDVLTEVNGEALDSIDKAIGLVTKLRHASNLSVTLMRGGNRVRKEIQIS